VDFQLNLHTESIEHAKPAVPVAVEPLTSVRQVLGLMRDRSTGSVLVCQEKRLLGIFTERDALKLLASGSCLDVPIREVMTPNPTTLRADDTVATAIRKMSFGTFRRLPIVDSSGRVVGILRASQIVRYMVEHFPQTVYTLPPEPHPMTHEREGA
jgi:CBS domain-containing protein